MTPPEHDQLEHDLSSTIAGPTPGHWQRLRAGLAARAGQEGLLDVAYAGLDSPIGPLLVAATQVGVVRVAFDNEPTEQVLAELSRRVSPRVLAAPSRLEDTRRQLEEYFQGSRTRFDLPLDWSLSRGFRREVLAATAAIPYGATGSYRSVATAAGRREAVRAAGTALATNPLPVLVPCHRVLRSSGALGQYRGGPERKDHLLRLEQHDEDQL